MQQYNKAITQTALWIITNAIDVGVENYVNTVSKQVDLVSDLLSKLYERNAVDVWSDLRKAIIQIENQGITVKISTTTDDKKAIFEYGLLKNGSL
ncbi:MAG: hypothetical protein QXL17_02945 [Candidatus Thermoplasmatota archaeon]